MRFGKVFTITTWYGLIFGTSAVASRLRPKSARPAYRDGDQWVRMLISLGPSYIKIGQLLSTRRDLLPESVCEALGRLTDGAPPPSRRSIEKAVRAAYAHIDWPFASFDWTPIACGSIATVHDATTTDGRRVAVKVRRPGIERVMMQDFKLTAAAMGMLGRMPSPKLRAMPFKIMHHQVGTAILRQLDFPAEQRSLELLRANLTHFDNVRLPASIPQLCTESTVVMDFMDDLTRFGPGDLDAEQRSAIVRAVLTVTYEMLFVDGLVHCDMHPGNLYFDRDAQLVILDAGFVIKLSDKVRASFSDFFINMAMGNGKMAGQVVIDSAAELAPNTDLDGFRTEVAKLVAESSGAQSGEFNLADFAGRLFGLQRTYGVYPTPEFVFPLLSLLVIEGMIKGFDSGIDFQAEAMPVLRRRNMPRTAATVG